MPREKICVIGCGPIGTLTCLYICLNQECDITFIDTHHDKEWINTYCVWESEVLDTWLWTFLDNIKVSVVKKKWDYSAYIFQKEAIKLKQPYYMLDNQQLKSTIYGELSKRGVRFINGHVSNIEESDGYVDVCFSNVRYEHIAGLFHSKHALEHAQAKFTKSFSLSHIGELIRAIKIQHKVTSDCKYLR